MSSEKIGEIKNRFINASFDEYQDLFDKYSDDDRKGVVKLIDTYKKHLISFEK